MWVTHQELERMAKVCADFKLFDYGESYGGSKVRGDTVFKILYNQY